jgi:ABC-type branched-subunit amino acid transport system ATPase component
VDEVDLSVRQARIVGLIGPNGAGKTTLMDGLWGFTRYRGSVVLQGRALDGLPPHRRAAQGLGRTFQGIDLYEDLSVEENVIVGQHRAPGRGSEQLATVLDALGLAAQRRRAVAGSAAIGLDRPCSCR